MKQEGFSIALPLELQPGIGNTVGAVSASVAVMGGLMSFLSKARKAASTRPDIDDVFSLSTIPSAGYVDRSSRPELRAIEDGITTRGRSIVVLGPAKVGKSVFVNKVIQDKLRERPIALSGRSIKTMDDFWLRLVAVSGGYVREKIIAGKTRRTTAESELTMQVGNDLLGASTKLRGAVEFGEDRSAEYKRLYNLATLGEELFVHFRPVVLIEDFHEIESEALRREIASVAKQFGEKEQAKFVFVATSEPELKFFNTDPQLRAVIYVFPDWGAAELEKVVESGFAKLGYEIDPTEVERKLLVRECFGSPAILNALCANAAKVAKRRTEAARLGGPVTVATVDIAEALRRQVEEYRSFAEIPLLALAQSTVADRVTFYPIGKGKGTIYHLILEALRQPGLAEPHGVGQDAIRNRIREILGRPTWLSATLGQHLAALAATNIRIEHRKLFGRLPERPMSYDAVYQKFTVNDPTLRTYLYRGGQFRYL